MLIDGKKIAQAVLAKVKHDVAALQFQPVFCDILVGNDAVALSYVNIKGKAAERMGMRFMLKQYPQSIDEKDLLQEVYALNRVPDMCGLIVQLPLPGGLSREAVLDAIDPALDVDCIGSLASQAFYGGRSELLPPTGAAVMEILRSVPVALSGVHAVVVGQGELVGKPVAHMLRQSGAMVSTVDRSTKNWEAITKTADIIVCGTGQPGLLKGEAVKPGAVVVDAGTAETGSGIVGDVDLDSVLEKAGYVSPVPGGVGPVTVAMLLANVVSVAQRRSRGFA